MKKKYPHQTILEGFSLSKPNISMKNSFHILNYHNVWERSGVFMHKERNALLIRVVIAV